MSVAPDPEPDTSTSTPTTNPPILPISTPPPVAPRENADNDADDDEEDGLPWIAIGVGIAVAICVIAAVIGVFFLQKKQKSEASDPLLNVSTNEVVATQGGLAYSSPGYTAGSGKPEEAHLAAQSREVELPHDIAVGSVEPLQAQPGAASHWQQVAAERLPIDSADQSRQVTEDAVLPPGIGDVERRTSDLFDLLDVPPSPTRVLLPTLAEDASRISSSAGDAGKVDDAALFTEVAVGDAFEYDVAPPPRMTPPPSEQISPSANSLRRSLDDAMVEPPPRTTVAIELDPYIGMA